MAFLDEWNKEKRTGILLFMADSRRYKHAEVEEIFDRALSNKGRAAKDDGTETGATLVDLQTVGKELGVEPTRIAEAAYALDTKRGALPREKSLGMPIGVGRVIDLPGTITHEQWESLVAQMRATFGGGGQITSHDGLRRWTQGGLTATLEPTATGHQLRVIAKAAGGRGLNRLGLGGLVIGFALVASTVMTGYSPVPLELAMLFSNAAGVVLLTLNTLRLPGWARRKEGQIEYLGERLQALLATPGDEVSDT